MTPSAAPAEARVLERSDDVLWTIAPPGVVLHNLKSHRFLELDALGYSLWAYLDGARSVNEVVEKAVAAHAGASAGMARRIVEVLDEHGFLASREL